MSSGQIKHACPACRDTRYWSRGENLPEKTILLRKQGYGEPEIRAIYRAHDGRSGDPLVPCFACNPDGAMGAPTAGHNPRFWRPLLDVGHTPGGCAYRIVDPVSGRTLMESDIPAFVQGYITTRLGDGPLQAVERDAITKVYTNSTGSSLALENYANVYSPSHSYTKLTPF